MSDVGFIETCCFNEIRDGCKGHACACRCHVVYDERDNPKRLTEHILALMVERDQLRAQNERLTTHLREIETMAARHEESAEWEASAAIPAILGRARRALRGERD